MSDRDEIRELIENWVVWRDAGDWERFAGVWHSDGWMTATWFQGPASRFIEVSRDAVTAAMPSQRSRARAPDDRCILLSTACSRSRHRS